MIPTRIAHVGIAVKSIDALIPFYRDVLGLPDVRGGTSVLPRVKKDITK